MKILLVAMNAKYIHSNLAVYSLRAYAKKHGVDVELVEFTINNRVDEILEQLYRSKPQMLFFSCYIWNISYVRELAEEFRRLCPQVPIWVGGPEVSFETEAFLQENPGITGIMVGEGEETFLQLCRDYELSTTQGIVYRDCEGTIHCNEPRPLLSMDDIPFCYDAIEDLTNRIIYYESSRGCPFSCSYCLSSVDKKLRFRSLGLVFAELQFFLDQKVPQVKFVDRTFNCKHDHAMAIWQYLTEHDNGVTNFHFEISADLLSQEELALIRTMRPGLVQFEIGVQTVNEKTIAEIHRSMDLVALEEKVHVVRASGNVHQHLDLIAGLPFENFESFKHSFDVVYNMRPQQLQLGFLKVLKGSYMFSHAEEYGLVYRKQPPYEVLATKWISYEEILKLKLVEEVLEIHYNSGQFLCTISYLEECFDRPFDLYMSLGQFYLERGYRGQNYSRMRRSEILLEFAISIDPAREALYKETLTFDLYVRENVKSRPSWLKDEALIDKKQQLRFLRSIGYDKKYCHLEWFGGELLSRVAPGDGSALLEGGWILFDYEDRDVMTNEADVRFVGHSILVET